MISPDSSAVAALTMSAQLGEMLNLSPSSPIKPGKENRTKNLYSIFRDLFDRSVIEQQSQVLSDKMNLKFAANLNFESLVLALSF